VKILLLKCVKHFSSTHSLRDRFALSYISPLLMFMQYLSEDMSVFATHRLAATSDLVHDRSTIGCVCVHCTALRC